MVKEHHLQEGDGVFIPNQNKSTDEMDQQLLDKIDVYFHEPGERRFVPRAVLVDLEPGTLDVIKESPVGKLFKPDNFLFGASGII